MKRSYWIVGAVGVSLLFLGVAINFLMSFAASRAADRFLDRLSEGKPAEAYSMTTRAYRQGMKPKDFARMIRLWNLRSFSEKEDWESQTGNSQVTLSGNIKTKTGQPVPLRMKLVKEEGEWRVALLEGPPPPQIHYLTMNSFSNWRRRRGKEETATPPPAPPAQAEINRLVRTTLLDLDKALDKEDFKDFQASVCEDWREHAPIAMFERQLRPRGEHDLDLGQVAKAEPVFEAKVRPDGVLTADGKYMLSPNVLDFWLHYVQEPDKQWRLTSIRLGWRNRSPEEMDEEE
ncbi:MAG: hypothetical protein EHM61_03260 [Acidobacteria bacterium]|nr:MAG: hypothetical protein EHM61_03260 [Acidobacteriota bacterium]